MTGGISSDQRQWLASALGAVLSVDPGYRNAEYVRQVSTESEFSEMAQDLSSAARRAGATLPPAPRSYSGGGGYRSGGRPPSAKQIALIFKLRQQAGLPRGVAPATGRAASDEIDRLIAERKSEGPTGPQLRKIGVMRRVLAGQGKPDPTGGVDPSTKREASTAIAAMVAAEKEPSPEHDPTPPPDPQQDHTPSPEDMQEYIDRYGQDNAAEAWLDDQEHEPDPPARPAGGQTGGTEVEADKFYMVGDVPVMIVKSKTGDLYGRKRVKGKKGWQYERGLINQARRHGREMTLDEAAKHSAHLGCCIACGRTLTAKKSAADGIGPVCRKKFRQD